MKSKIFEVPEKLMVEFAIELSDRQLTGELTGANNSREIQITVFYEENEREDVYDLIKWLDDRIPDEEEEDENEDDDEDEDDDD